MIWSLAAFVMGFLGSLHCVGMCGPIALALPLNRSSQASMWQGILTYNFSRALAYAFIGGLLAFTGQSLAWLFHTQYISLALGGLLLLGFGLYYLKPSLFHRLPSNRLLRLVKQELGALFKQRSMKGLASIGFLNAFLPCGLLYAAFAGALATGMAWKGAVFMALFGLGTVPAMAAVAFAPQLLKGKLRINVNKLVPIAGMSIALLLLLRGMSLGIPYLSPKMERMESNMNTKEKTEVKIHCCGEE